MTPDTSRPAPDPAPSRARPTVPDHELFGLIGQGSYGDVWLARNIMGGWRAVKIVYRDRFQSSRPFDREFGGIQRYEPISRGADGLVPVLHVGHHDGAGSFFYVMELADPEPTEDSGTVGFPTPLEPATYRPRTLRSDLERLGRLPVEECLEIGLSLTAGLAHLHRHRLVHRDLKPANVVFVQAHAKLADAGLVGDLGDSHTLVGTEGYIPPEGPGSVGADLYALGKLLYEAATGLAPDEFPNPPGDWLSGEMPAGALELHEILLRACESDPERRYRTAAAFQADLALLRSGQSVRRARRLERRVRTLRRAGAVATVIAILGVGMGLFAGFRARVERENAARAEGLLRRAELAESAARSRLAEVQLSRAGLERRLGLAGQRFRALDLVREASASSTNLAALRTEAVAALTLADLREVRSLDLTGPPGDWLNLDARFERYTRAHPDGSVRLHAWEDHRELATLEQARAEGLLVWPFSDEGRWLGGRRRSQAWVWDTSTGRIVWQRVVPDLYALDLLPGDRGIALQHLNGRLDWIRLPEGTTERTLESPERELDFWFSPDGARIAFFSRSECLAHLYDARTGARLQAMPLPTPACPIDLLWNPDSRGLLFSADDFRGYFLRLDSPGSSPLRLEGHTAEIIAMAIHPAQPWAVTSSWDGTTRLWSTESGKPYVRHDGGGYGLRWRPDGRLGWIERPAVDRFRLVEMETALPEGLRLIVEPIPARALADHKGPWDVRFLAGDRVLAVGSHDGLRLWPLDSLAEPHSVPLEQTRWLETDPDQQTLWLGTTAEVVALPFRWDGAASRFEVGPIRRTGIRGHEIPLAGTVPGLGPIPVLAAQGTALWRMNDAPPRLLGQLPGWSTCLALSPDGHWVLAGQKSPEGISLASATNGALVRALVDSQGSRGLFSLDSRSIFVLSGTRLRREPLSGGPSLWSVSRTVPFGARALALSPDGTTLAAASNDREIALHDAALGELWCVLDSPDRGILGELRFGITGRYLAATTANHTIRVWDLAHLRTRLRAMKLDWSTPPPVVADSPTAPFRFSTFPVDFTRGVVAPASPP